MFREKTVWRWGAAAMALLLLLSLPSGYTARVKGFFKDVLTPVQGFFLKGASNLKAGVDSVRGFGGLAEENRLLRQEIINLQTDLRILKTLEEKYLHLSAQLEFHNEQTIELIPAQVVTRSINGWWQSVGLGKGSRSGIRPNRAVISPDGLVGRTAEVSGRSAEVLLVSDPACKVSARISRTGSFGLVTGRGVSPKGYPVARMQFIHKDTPVRIGDEVVTSGLGGVFPRDILIGYVEAIRTEEAGLYQVADVLPQAVINLTDVVFVTTSENVSRRNEVKTEGEDE